MTVLFEQVSSRLFSKNLKFSIALLAALLGSPDHRAEQLTQADSDESYPSSASGWFSPASLVMTPDGRHLIVGCATSPQLLILESQNGGILGSIRLPAPASGLAIKKGSPLLYVTCTAPSGRICEVDVAAQRLIRILDGGQWPLNPVISNDGQALYVCERFASRVDVYDLPSGILRRRIVVDREPIAAALTPDGQELIVAHHLPSGRSNTAHVASTVSFIDTSSAKVVRKVHLANGTSLVREIKISPDGRFAGVTHNLARFQVPTTQAERGWMNTSALTLIDLTARAEIHTVLLDEVDRGAANPWSLDWSADGQWICVSHAGTHELSLIQSPELIAKLAKAEHEQNSSQDSVDVAPVSSDLAFLVGLRHRVKLHGKGPRSLVVASNQVFIADYFSDLIETVDLRKSSPSPTVLPLHGIPEMSQARRGEMLFNDADICFQGWQSCATCHSDDARIDGLNWDLLNDGVGNPKNTKSLLWSHRTPPAMSTGVRETAETAVRAGLRHILFSVQPDDVASAIDAYLKSLRPVPSPYLIDGALSASAHRGQSLFESARVGCSGCHSGALWTNLGQYDVGTSNDLDLTSRVFDTPTLAELWRTGPYFHDGSAATLRDVVTTRNPNDRHGHTSQLTEDQIQDLVEYLLSL